MTMLYLLFITMFDERRQRDAVKAEKSADSVRGGKGVWNGFGA